MIADPNLLGGRFSPRPVKPTTMTADPTNDGVSRRTVLKAVGTVGTTAGVASRFVSPVAAERGPLAGFGGTACKTARTSDENLPFGTDDRYGGWGGHEYHCTDPGTEQNPIVFVHGNTHDGCDFAEHATEYLERGYGGDALWSITFREATSTHPEMRDQLEEFVTKIRGYTGADTVDLVSHSLGVTGARFWMDDNDRYEWVDTFVGCAGANHGTYTCGPTCEPKPGASEPCQFISPACAEPGGPLYDLNTPDETPGDVDYYTIRGTADYFYADDPDSPRLEGANRNVVIDGGHNATRASERSIDLIFEWATDGTVVPDTETGSGRPVSATGSRSDDGSAFTAGQTDRVDLTVEADAPVVVRDTIPYEWDVLEEHSPDLSCIEPHPHRGVIYLHFTGDEAPKRYSVSYLVEAPDDLEDTKTYTFGPVEVRRPDSERWSEIPGTEETNTVAGVNSDG